MTKGPLGGPRPFAHPSLTVEVRLKGIGLNDVGTVTLKKIEQNIEGRLDLDVGDVGYDESMGTVMIEIKDGRISPKEANAAAEIAFFHLHADEKTVIITV